MTLDIRIQANDRNIQRGYDFGSGFVIRHHRVLARLARDIDPAFPRDFTGPAGIRSDRILRIQLRQSSYPVEIFRYRFKTMNLPLRSDEPRGDGRQISDIRANIEKHVAATQE